VAEALDKHEAAMRTAGAKESSLTTLRFRLDGIFEKVIDQELGCLTRHEIEKLLDEYAEDHAPTTVLNVLDVVKAFYARAVMDKVVAQNPAKDIVGPGRRRAGKDQLRVDEARRWLACALEMAPAHHEALAATLTLLLGMRASEIAGLAVRDLDDEGRLLWVAAGGGKTEAARRRLEVPELIRSLLLTRAEGRAGEQPLFGVSRFSVRWWVRKICRLAGVPVVSAHGLRGTHSTLATTAGATAHFVISAMGHTSFDVTRKHYLAPGVEENARARRTFDVLQGGKSVNDTVQSFTDAESGSQTTSLTEHEKTLNPLE
jgi:integrase